MFGNTRKEIQIESLGENKFRYDFVEIGSSGPLQYLGKITFLQAEYEAYLQHRNMWIVDVESVSTTNKYNRLTRKGTIILCTDFNEIYEEIHGKLYEEAKRISDARIKSENELEAIADARIKSENELEAIAIDKKLKRIKAEIKNIVTSLSTIDGN